MSTAAAEDPLLFAFLSRKIFPSIHLAWTSELSEEQRWEALSKHAECWTGDVVDPSVATATVKKPMVTGHEETAGDRLDAVLGRLEK